VSRRVLLAALALAALTGCGDLETGYAARGKGSVNGVDVLHARLAAATSLVAIGRLSPRAAERDLLVHVSRGDGLPDQAACAWIADWLEEPDRRFVLVLRDGTVAPWLCRRWAAEARADAARSPERRAELEAAAVRLDQRAEREASADAPLVPPGEVRRCDLFAVRAFPEVQPVGVAGLWTGAAPATMRLRSVPEAEGAETLLSADGQPWAVSIPIGEGRLVVIAGGTALLDAAQVDRSARALTAALVADLVAPGVPPRAGWVEHLAVRGDEEPPPPNILAMLFGTPPFSWAAFHLLALIAVLLAWKATWLGRTEARADHRLERFSRHLDALARQLRRARALREVVEAVARALGRAPPARLPATADEAFAVIQDLYRPETRRAPPAEPNQP
jgi:hypothetical protein